MCKNNIHKTKTDKVNTSIIAKTLIIQDSSDAKKAEGQTHYNAAACATNLVIIICKTLTNEAKFNNNSNNILHFLFAMFNHLILQILSLFALILHIS